LKAPHRASTRRTGSAGWNAAASSAQQLTAGADGWLEFVFPENTTQKVIGLSDTDVSDQPSTIDYGIGLSPSPLRLEIWENGVVTPLSGTPVPGELLRIERKSGTVRYWRNGVLVRTAPTASTSSLLIDASFNQADASVAAINASFAESRPVVTSRRLEYDHADRPTKVFHTLEGSSAVEWTKLVGVEKSPSGGLRKTAGAGWGNAGASSSQLIPAGSEGYVEVTVRSTSGNRVFGLSQKDENAGIDKLDFGILLSGGNVQVYERGANRATFGSYAVGDVLRVQRTLGQITYRKNNVVLFTSSTASATSLVADVAIETASGEMESVRISVKGKEVLLSDTRYNALGNVVDKKLHSTDNGAHVRQSVDYRYNIRGWITHINSSDLSPHEAGDPRDLFGMELGYTNDLGTGEPAVPQFNGNISSIKWSANLGLGMPAGTKERSYNYTYDAMNRILSASFRERKAAWSQDGSYSESGYTYDNNGNILSLTRKGAMGLLMDVLTYDYGAGMGKTNRLLKVGDSGDRKEGFRERTNTGMDYAYDANGNMISDANKDITSITYNHLNLPSKVAKVTGDYVCYLYDAGGRKLGQWVYEAVPKRITKTTDYLGECIYENDALQLVQHEEGRVVPQASGSGTFDYQYHLKDHLGNVRLTFSSKVEKDQDLATLENDRQSEEQSIFQNYSRVSADLFDHTDAGLGYTYAQRLTGGTGAIVGLAKSLKVEPGDTLQVEAFAKYLNTSGGPSNVSAGLAAAIAGAFGLGPTAVGEPAAAYSSINSLFSAGSLLAADPGVDPGAPKAFLNILLFDGKYNLVDLAYDQISASAKQEVGEVTKQPHDRLYRELVVSQPGYAYIYVSNENPTLVEVYFDDLNLTHQKSPVVQWDDYYPFGLTFDSYSRENSTAQDYKYNGKEEQNELGLGWLDFGFRMYDPAVAKFTGIDPLASKYHWLTPYNYAENSPVANIDLWGLQRYFAADGSLLGQVGDNTDVRVVNSTMTNQQATEHIQSGSAESTQALTGGSVAFADYFQTVADVTNDAALQTYSNNGNNCFDAATAQLTDAGVTQTGSADAIQTLVNTTADPGLTENAFGGAIRVQTELNAGNPVMVGVKETTTGGTAPDPGNTNSNTGHFVVIRSVTVAADGTVSFNYLDNAKASTGKSADNNNFSLNTSTGAMSDTTTPGGRTSYSKYEVSEVRKNN
jgi:RHS repeat-associated protein